MGRDMIRENLTYTFRKITYYDVLIMEKWRYNGFEKCLYMDSYHESYNKGEDPILGPGGSSGFSVFIDGNTLFGIFEFYFETEGVYIGLAINPQFVGRGYSRDFILAGLEFGKDNFNTDVFKLAVHRKNIQAIKAYDKTGFKLFKRDGDELHYSLMIK